MRNFLATLSLIFIIIGAVLIGSMMNEQVIASMLTFGYTGPLMFLFLIIYSTAAVVFAYLAKGTKYRALVLTVSITLLVVSLFISFVGAFAFRNP
ncbi:hypothetical protein [Jeotgalibacillus aurantiacus]|uniref:hypothetical protein n=1 Tax=Jeotgalibacillus aurantiacus TaxID=2763266 RepID=UPI001D0BCB99|nr:hypothetical protein [Jeotgalibacillus aurantiacus]